MKNPFKKKKDNWEEEAGARIDTLRNTLVKKHGLSHVVVGDIMKETTHLVLNEVLNK